MLYGLTLSDRQTKEPSEEKQWNQSVW